MSLKSKTQRMEACLVQLNKQLRNCREMVLECRPVPNHPQEPEQVSWTRFLAFDDDGEAHRIGEYNRKDYFNITFEDQIIKYFPDFKKGLELVKGKKKLYLSLVEVIENRGWLLDHMYQLEETGVEINECILALTVYLEHSNKAAQIQSIVRMYNQHKIYLEHLKYKPGGLGFLEAQSSFNENV